MLLLRKLLPLGALTALLACGPSDDEVAAQTYATTMTPVLAENLTLARAHLVAAAAAQKSNDGAAIAERVHAEYAPAAKSLHARAVAATPTEPTLAETHGQLVRAWNDRATAYAELDAAWASRDVNAFDAAVKKNLRAHLEEEAYFNAINAQLAPYGLHLEQYPQ